MANDQIPEGQTTWSQMMHSSTIQTGLDDCPVYIRVSEDGPLIPYQGIVIQYDGPGIGEPVRVILFGGEDLSKKEWRKRDVG